MPAEPGLIFRPLTSADLDAAHGLSRAVSWPHRLEDWGMFLDLGVGIAACDRAGSLLGTAMWWPYGAEAGTLGMVLVAPAQQGRGIGRRLMEAILEDAGARALMLNATPAGLQLYQALGFRAVGQIRQHQGVFHTAAATRARRLRPGDHCALRALDQAAFGALRASLIDTLVRAGEGAVVESDGAIVGFAIARAFGRGRVIGPLVAGDEADAIALAAAAATPGFLRMDIPAEATQLAQWLGAAGLPVVDTVTTMVRGEWPATSTASRRFALTSQALG